MSEKNRFNLIDEPWIPVVDVGRASLRQIFTHPEYRALGGNPVQKIAITKLLLAIAQAAATPEDDEAWSALGPDGMAKACVDYLEQWYDRFWLYGEKPFLQMLVLEELISQRKRNKLNSVTSSSQRAKVLREASPKEIGAGFYPDLLSENNTILTQYQINTELSDSERAVFLVTLMNFSFGGKRIEKGLPPLTEGYTGKTVSARPGPSLGNYVGYLHSLLVAERILPTLFINLLTREQIKKHRYWEAGLGKPPWERMPSGEDCKAARNLKSSYQGCLLAMSRFVLFKGPGIYYVEGIQYPSHKEGWREPGIAIKNIDSSKEIKVMWVDPQKRPWRLVTALLSFISSSQQQGYYCEYLAEGLGRARKLDLLYGIWSGGLKVRSNSGDQSVKQDDDFVESLVLLDNASLGEQWYLNLSQEMSDLESIAKRLYSATLNFYKMQEPEKSKLNEKWKSYAAMSSNLFWQLAERHFQPLVDACDPDEESAEKRKVLRNKFAMLVTDAFDNFCPHDTARQLEAWAKCRPNLADYLNQGEST